MSYGDWIRYPVTSNRYKLGSAGYLFGHGNDITKLVNKLPNRNISKSDMPFIPSKRTDNMIGAIISGVVGLASALGSVFSSKSASKKASAEAERQRQWQEYMWNKSNEYNSPSQQLARYKEAGLNPNLVFGQGASSLAAQFGSGAAAPGNVSVTPQYGDALKGISDAIMLYNQYKQTQSNIALQDEQIKTQRTQQKLNEAEAAKKGSEKTGIDWQNRWNVIMEDTNWAISQSTMNKLHNENLILTNEFHKSESELNMTEMKELIMKSSLVDLCQEQKLKNRLLIAQAFNDYMSGQAAADNASANVMLANQKVQNLIIEGKLTNANFEKVCKEIEWFDNREYRDWVKTVGSAFSGLATAVNKGRNKSK